jgi:hypothetical protein
VSQLVERKDRKYQNVTNKNQYTCRKTKNEKRKNVETKTKNNQDEQTQKAKDEQHESHHK